MPAFHEVVPSGPDVVVGGHSYGGRVASLAAAEPDAPYAALVLFCFPLHPPGIARADRGAHRATARRSDARRSCSRAKPTRSPGSSSCVRPSGGSAVPAELVTYPRLGHGLKPVLDDALDRVAAFLGEVANRPTST